MPTCYGLGGNDGITATTLPAGIIKLTIDGSAGNDTLLGSQGADVLLGGDGNDFVFGDNGNDIAFLGTGDDVFQWNPGDGNDTIEGQAGRDEMLFNGANVAEIVDISANGGRVRFFRNIANVVMDTNDLEVITFNALGGADTIVVNDLSGTDVTDVQLNLAAVGGVADTQPDTVILNGTNGNDVIQVSGSGSNAQVFGLAATLAVSGAESVNDRLQINSLAGNDVIDASGLAGGSIQLSVDAGDGDDVAIGGAGNDTLLGGAGDDVLIGGAGVDVLDGGAGDNIVIQ